MKQDLIANLRLLGRAVLVTSFAAIVAGCGMSSIGSGLGSSIFGGGDKAADPASVTETSLLNAAKGDGGSASGAEVGIANACPQFAIWPNDKLLTVYESGRAGDGLAIIHRGELTRTARECTIEPGRVTVKYGFSGRVLLGPRGRPGKISLPIEVHVTDKNRQNVQTETVRVDVDIQPDKPIGYFSTVRVVTIPLTEGGRPADYRLYVAFDKAGAPS